jgi:protein transport protein SEC13
VAWSHPRFGSLLASCGYDAKVFIWKENQQTGEWEVFFEYAHESSINSVSWAPAECGAMLAVGSSDTNITVLMHTGAGEATFKPVKFSAHQMGVNAVAFAPTAPVDGDHGRKPRIASGGCDNIVKVWTSSNNSTTWDSREIGKHDDWVRDVAFAANIGTPRNVLASASEDGTCKIFVDDKGDMTEWAVADIIRPGKSGVWCVSWSVSGQILAVTTADAAVTLYKEDMQGKWNAVTDITDQGATPRAQ